MLVEVLPLRVRGLGLGLVNLPPKSCRQMCLRSSQMSFCAGSYPDTVRSFLLLKKSCLDVNLCSSNM